jgi:hypothetical protein
MKKVDEYGLWILADNVRETGKAFEKAVTEARGAGLVVNISIDPYKESIMNGISEHPYKADIDVDVFKQI